MAARLFTMGIIACLSAMAASVSVNVTAAAAHSSGGGSLGWQMLGGLAGLGFARCQRTCRRLRRESSSV